jgi:hypothetical protein
MESQALKTAASLQSYKQADLIVEGAGISCH